MKPFLKKLALQRWKKKIGALRFIEGKLKDGTTNKRELRMSGEVFIKEATKPRTRSRKK
jgi:hypothetical protein